MSRCKNVVFFCFFIVFLVVLVNYLPFLANFHLKLLIFCERQQHLRNKKPTAFAVGVPLAFFWSGYP
jgi:hypothetical protein